VNFRLAYAAFQEVFQGTRWAALTAQVAKPQRPLWASTGVKNPDYSDTMYITELVVADTVNTMLEKTLPAFADHGEAQGDKVTGPPRGHRRCSTPSNASASKPQVGHRVGGRLPGVIRESQQRGCRGRGRWRVCRPGLAGWRRSRCR
jgi:transaldolase